MFGLPYVNDLKELLIGYQAYWAYAMLVEMGAWGLWLPFWMKASWFKKHGYKPADRNGISLLVWKPFADEALPPRWIHPKNPVPTVANKVSVTAFINGWCPAQNMMFERAQRACAAFPDKVIFTRIDTSKRETFLEWGISDGIYLDGKLLSFGPPLTFDKMMAKIEKRVKKLPS